MNEENKRMLLSTLCHGSILLNFSIVSIAIPLAIFGTSKDRVVRANAKEALNFHLTIFIWCITSFILILSLIMVRAGIVSIIPLILIRFIPLILIRFIPLILIYLIFLLAIIMSLRSIILPICGVVAVIDKPDIPYYYPGILRLIK